MVMAPTRRADRAQAAAVEALVRGNHGDPFALLGPHRDGEGQLVVRTFQPHADRVWVLDQAGQTLAELSREHPSGLFVGGLGSRPMPFAYRLRLEAGGQTFEIQDPYRFGEVLGELDVYLIGEGNHLQIYEKLGAHPMEMEGVAGVGFLVWAPSASRVSVVGNFNAWDGRRHPMRKRVECGVWELFVPDLGRGEVYKFEIKGPQGELLPLKADPFAFAAERPPRTASLVQGLGARAWNDQDWMRNRAAANARERATAISAIASWPTGSSPTSGTWASPISS
jgi:1,4-alpha-glucan branching enzyme